MLRRWDFKYAGFQRLSGDSIPSSLPLSFPLFDHVRRWVVPRLLSTRRCVHFDPVVQQSRLCWGRSAEEFDGFEVGIEIERGIAGALLSAAALAGGVEGLGDDCPVAGRVVTHFFEGMGAALLFS